jgi:hypothetical protein
MESAEAFSPAAASRSDAPPEDEIVNKFVLPS